MSPRQYNVPKCISIHIKHLRSQLHAHIHTHTQKKNNKEKCGVFLDGWIELMAFQIISMGKTDWNYEQIEI